MVGAVVFTVSVLVTALPFGVTEAGANVQVASAGNPLQEKLTAVLNPFMGVTVKVAVPLCPLAMVRLEGLTDNWKSGGGTLIVYCATATALFA